MPTPHGTPIHRSRQFLPEGTAHSVRLMTNAPAFAAVLREAFPLDRNVALPDRDPHDPSVRGPVFLVWLRHQPGGGRDARDLT